MKRWIRYFFLPFLLIAIFGSVQFGVFAWADTETSTLNVSLTIPTVGGGSVGGSGPPAPPPLSPPTPPPAPTPTTTATTTLPTADTTVPAISALDVSVTDTAATISWQTDEPADSQVLYGTTAQYGKNETDSTFTASHTISISSLIPNTTYHFKIVSTDAAGNSAGSKDQTLTTDKEAVPPPDVSHLTLTPGTTSLTLTWTNPSAAAVPDFKNVRIIRKANASPASPTDGTVVYTGSGQAFINAGVTAAVTYYYVVFSVDTSGNMSGGAEVSGQTTPPPPREMCTNGIDDDGDGKIDCADSSCTTDAVCQAATSTPPPPATPEVCDNGQDDDQNGQADCADTACVGFAACAAAPAATGGPGAPGVTYAPPASTVSGPRRIDQSEILYLVGRRTIRLVPAGNTLTLPAGTPLTIIIPEQILLNPPQSLSIIIDGAEQHRFAYSATSRQYSADVSAPRVGAHQAYIEIDYGSGQFDSLGFVINSFAWGQVTADGRPLEGATVTLLQNGQPADLSASGQSNPVLTTGSGLFVWVVPNGDYAIIASQEGYYERKTLTYPVRNNTINVTLELVAKPPALAEVIDLEKPLTENIAAAAKNIGQKTAALTKRIKQKVVEAVDNPKVEKTTEQVVVPTVVTASAVGTLALITWADLLPLLRLLFLQPLLLLGRRQRTGWGQVYNALNKLPIDLATVRLLDATTGKLLQTRVTDKKGRYAFVVNPRTYRIEASKTGLVFPSQLLINFHVDGRRLDIYHGEAITATERDAVITANIPLDPAGEQKIPSRLIWQRIGRAAQVTASWLGIAITTASFYISPRWYIGALLAVHILLFIIFHRLAIPRKIKSWGIVKDAAKAHPVGRVVARLFNSQFNKLVSTQITDGRGRYYFLAGDALYYVTYEHDSYQPHKTDIIDLSGQEAENIAVDVGLQKKDGAPPAPSFVPPPPPPPPAQNNTQSF